MYCAACKELCEKEWPDLAPFEAFETGDVCDRCGGESVVLNIQPNTSRVGIGTPGSPPKKLDIQPGTVEPGDYPKTFSELCSCGHKGGNHKMIHEKLFPRLDIGTGECQECPCFGFKTIRNGKTHLWVGVGPQADMGYLPDPDCKLEVNCTTQDPNWDRLAEMFGKKAEVEELDTLPFSQGTLVRLLIEVEQRGCGGENWQDRVAWIIKTAAERAEEK